MSLTNVSSMFNTKRLFNVLATFHKNRDSKLAKAVHVPPENVLPSTGPQAPLLSSESVVLSLTDRSSLGLKRVKAINKNTGKAIQQRRRREKGDLLMDFFGVY
jgi:hypothetical protein